MPHHNRQGQTVHPEARFFRKISTTDSMGARVHRSSRRCVDASRPRGRWREMRNVPRSGARDGRHVRSNQRHHHVQLPQLPRNESRENFLRHLPQELSLAQCAAMGGTMAKATAIEIEVNGKRYPVQYDPETPLLYVLRDELGLTGSKYGCGEGQCGACTVLIGGAPRRSCQIPVSAAAAKPITTIEGLEKDGWLNTVQQGFLDAGAFQCAYCTSGMIMSSVGLLETNPNPSASDVVQGLQGNMCRCGTHPRIVEAVGHAAKAMRE